MDLFNGFRVNVIIVIKDNMLIGGSGTGQHSFDRNPTESLVAAFGRVRPTHGLGQKLTTIGYL